MGADKQSKTQTNWKNSSPCGRQLHWWRAPCQTVLKGGWVSIPKDTKSNTLIKSQRQHPPGQTSRINRQKGQKNGHACVEIKMPD